MNRAVAKNIHEITNLTYWAENPDWHPNKPVLEFLCKCVRALPFSIHSVQKSLFFNDSVIAVNGETVVALDGNDEVNKFMFRYPDNMGIDAFEAAVNQEIGAVVAYLPGVALPTSVGIQTAKIFRLPFLSTDAVVQRQRRIDLGVNPSLNVEALETEISSIKRDKTAKDLAVLLAGTDQLAIDYGYYPDIALNSGNLRRDQIDGAVTLIDVMPVYENGGRLIADGADVLSSALESLRRIEDFVGRYGA